MTKAQEKSQAVLEEAAKLHQNGNLAEAERLYKRVLAKDSKNTDALHLLGVLHLQSSRPQIATELINRAVQLNPNIAIYRSNFAIALQGLGKFDEAGAQFKAAVKIDPGYFEAYNSLGHIFNDKGEYGEALKYYEQAIKANPNYGEALNNIGVVMQNLGRFDEATEYYKRALALNPYYVDAHNNLGSALQEKGLFEEALEAYRQALAIEPKHLAVHFNLGKSYLKLGNNEQAIKYFSHYLELDPDDLYGASLLLANLGRQPLPARASDAQLQRLYIKRAQSWRNISETDETYKAPQLVANTLLSLHKGDKIDILDAGCGTGLVGVLVKHIAAKLDGIDISLPMLEQAKSKQVYSTLHEGDMVSFMANNPNAYDAITCSATLIHFGDLNPAFHAASQALRPGGLFICTLFPNNGDEDISAATGSLMDGGGIYTHSPDYIKKAAANNDFAVELIETKTHEYHNGQAIDGLVVALRLVKSAG